MKKRDQNNNAATDGSKGGSCPINGPENGGSDEDQEYADDLLSEITGQEKPKIVLAPIDDLIPAVVKISERCLELGYRIGPETKKQDKRSLEVGGFYLVEKGDPAFAFKDFIVPKDLPVTKGSILVAEHYDDAAREIKELNRVNGTSFRMAAMFHVHPFNDTPYHSPADDIALDSLVNKMAKTTRRIFGAPYELIQDKIQKEYGDKSYILKGDELRDAVIKFIYPDDNKFFELMTQYGLYPDPMNFKKSEFLAKLLETIDHQTEEPRAVNFALSFVFNNSRAKPFIKMGIEETFMISNKKKRYTVTGPDMEIIDKGVNLPTAKDVAEIVRSRVKFPEHPFDRFIHFGKTGPKGKGIEKTLYTVPIGGADREFGNFPGRVPIGVGSSVGFSIGKPYPGVADRIESIKGQPDSIISAGATGNVFQGSVNLGKKEVQKKTQKNTYNYEEFAKLFTLACFMYRAEARHTDCKYSTYVDELLSQLGTFYSGNYTTSQFEHIARYNPQGKLEQPEKVNNGLKTCVLKIGPIAEDSPDIVEKFMPRFYSIDTIVRNIAEELAEKEDMRTVIFMSRFTKTGLSIRNRELQSYVNDVLNTAKKNRTPSDKPSDKSDNPSGKQSDNQSDKPIGDD